MHKIILSFILLCFQAGTLRCQLCQGSLGDPIVHLTFGAGANPGAALPGVTTGYQYKASDCPDDGFYAIRNSTANCFANTWHNLAADHTGNSNGYFMLVNGSYQPSAFFIDTVDLLCSNTTYEFAAWVLNMIKPTSCNGNTIQPNLFFSIEAVDGTVIQTYATGNIAPQSTPTWKQYGFFFVTPPNLSRVVLRLINNAPGGCGNDIALDDITFRPCGPRLNATIDGSALPKNICKGQPAQYSFSCTPSGFSNPQTQWQQSFDDGITWSDIAGANATTFTKDFTAATPVGVYKYRMTVAEMVNMAVPQCRVASDVLTVRVNANPVTTASNTSPVCEGVSLALNATGGSTYTWSGPNNYTAVGGFVVMNNPTQTLSGKYYVDVTNDALCTSRDSTIVTVRTRPNATIDKDTVSVCRGDSITLQAFGGNTYTWSPVDGLSNAAVANPKASPLQSTRYRVVVADQFLCDDSASIMVHVFEKPVVNAGADKVMAEGQSIQLDGTVFGTTNFFWSPSYQISSTQILNPVVSPGINTSYVLQAISGAGCGTASDTVNVTVYKKVMVPNAFSPNGDGVNDRWIIPALQAYKNFELTIYNRHGQLVYKTQSINYWDGTMNGKTLPPAAYYYVVDVKNGSPKSSGWLLLIK